jgi:RecJ-like exonuclease
MEEKTLLKIALVTSLVGLLILFLISDSLEIKETNIEKITFENKDEYVKVRGTVNNIIDTEKVTIITIVQPHEIKIIIFKDENNTMPIDSGNEIEAIGKVEEYDGALEIIADLVRVVR